MPVQCPLCAWDAAGCPVALQRVGVGLRGTSEGKSQPGCLGGSDLRSEDGLSPLRVLVPGATMQP